MLPKFAVRHIAMPVVPLCSVLGKVIQSVVPKGMSCMFMVNLTALFRWAKAIQGTDRLSSE